MIKQWEKLTNKIAEQFLIKYFDIQKEDIEEGIDWEWVNNSVGSIIYFADYYIDFSSVLECLNKDVDKDKYHEWYHWCLENHPQYISLQSFVWGASELKQKEEEQIKLLKNRVKLAEEELKNAIENFKWK